MIKSHACAGSCIALQKYCSNKLKNHIADRKRLKTVPGTTYCFIAYNSILILTINEQQQKSLEAYVEPENIFLF